MHIGQLRQCIPTVERIYPQHARPLQCSQCVLLDQMQIERTSPIPSSRTIIFSLIENSPSATLGETRRRYSVAYKCARRDVDMRYKRLIVLQQLGMTKRCQFKVRDVIRCSLIGYTRIFTIINRLIRRLPPTVSVIRRIKRSQVQHIDNVAHVIRQVAFGEAIPQGPAEAAASGSANTAGTSSPSKTSRVLKEMEPITNGKQYTRSLNNMPQNFLRRRLLASRSSGPGSAPWQMTAASAKRNGIASHGGPRRGSFTANRESALSPPTHSGHGVTMQSHHMLDHRRQQRIPTRRGRCRALVEHCFPVGVSHPCRPPRQVVQD